MSKEKKGSLNDQNEPDLDKTSEEKDGSPDNRNEPDSTDAPESGGAPGSGGDKLFTVEECRKAFNVSSAEFAGIMQSKKWAAGKKVTAEIFEEALKAFSGAAMGGK